MSIGGAMNRYRLRDFNRNVRSFLYYGVLINAGMALFTLLYNLYLLRLSFQEDFIGQVASMAPLATAILALPTGILSDRIGRRPFLIASGVLLAGSQLGLVLAESPTALLALSFVGGMGSAFIWVNHVAFLSDNAHPSRRAEALVIWTALQVVIRMLLSLGGGFMPGIMGYFFGMSTEMPETFRYVLFLGAVCSLAAVFPLLRISRAEAGDRQATGSEGEVSAEDDGHQPWRMFTAIAVLSGTRGFAVGLTFPFFNVFFEEELLLSPVAIGATFFLSQLVSLPATFSAPALVRRFGVIMTVLPVRAISGGALGIMGAFINLPIAVTMFLLVRVGEVIDNPTDQHFTTQILPRRFWARIQGFRVAGFQLMAFVGSLFGGTLIVDYGYAVAFGLACVSRVLSGLILGLVFGLRRGDG